MCHLSSGLTTDERRAASLRALSPRFLLSFLWRRLVRLWPALGASIGVLYIIGRFTSNTATIHRFFYTQCVASSFASYRAGSLRVHERIVVPVQ
jgi:peptidoglycan/LPS O-acetylase OafA/YrhL